MNINTFRKSLLIIVATHLFTWYLPLFDLPAFCQTQQPDTHRASNPDKNPAAAEETNLEKQENKVKESRTAAQTQPSGKEAIANISTKKIKEMASQIFAVIAKDKTVAFVDFTDASGQVTKGSQAVFMQVEPAIIEEGNRTGVSFIERKDLKLILDEWDLKSLYQAEGADAGAQALLGADYILTGKVLVADDNTLCTLKLVDLTSGKIVKSVSGKANIVKDIKPLNEPPAAQPPPQTSTIAKMVGEKADSNKTVSDDAKLSLWTSKREYVIGDKIEIFFSVTEPLYVQIIDVTPDGESNIIFPNDSQKDNFCLPGKMYRIPPENGDFELLVTPPAGIDRLKAIASPATLSIAAPGKTRGIQFTKTLVNTAETRANLTVIIR